MQLMLTYPHVMWGRRRDESHSGAIRGICKLQRAKWNLWIHSYSRTSKIADCEYCYIWFQNIQKHKRLN